MRSGSWLFSLLAALFVGTLVLGTLALAQTATTSLRGTVYDPKGAVVAGAALTISSPATGFSRTTKTDGSGNYQFLELPPAKYDLTVNAAGFATQNQTGMELMVASPATLNVTMQVTGGTITVEVSSAAPLVNTQDASLGHAFGTEQITNLPFEGRDPTAILSLQAGVVFTGNSTQINPTGDSRSGSVNGARSDQTNVELDGVDNNDQILGTAFAGAIRVPLDALQEFKVTTSNSDADTGRSSGGQVSLVTKSGTNHIHGGFFILNRPNFTPANDWFNKAAELAASAPNSPSFLLRNTFGANVGGPIIKDRFFFFVDYEGKRQREDLQVTRVVPSDLLRSGGIAYPCDVTDTAYCTASNPNVQSVGGVLIATLNASQVAQMDPNCSTAVGGFPNGTCPLGPGANPLLAYIPGNPNSSPTSLFNLYQHPNSDTVGDGLDFRGFTFPSPLPANENAFVVKLDYRLTRDGNHSLFVRGVMNNDRAAASFAPGGITNSATGNGGEQFPGQPQMQIGHLNNKGFTVGYTATLSSTLINNFRFGYTSQLGNLAGLETNQYIDFRGMDNLTAQTPTVNTHVPVKNIVDDLTKVIGNHTLQFGANYRLVDNIRQSNEENFFYGQTNVYWTNNSGISNTGSSLDPAAFGENALTDGNPNYMFPAVDPNFSASYDFAMAAMAGLITEVFSNYEQTKTLNVIPQGQLVPRHFRDNEFELYGQDQWRLKPNLTFTYGLRYSLLQPPFETTGLQSAPTTSLHDWFLQRGLAAAQGQAYEPSIAFNLSGPANGKSPYWGWDYNNFAPRVAVAYSPRADSGFWRKLWGGEGKTSIRAGYGIYFDHFGEGVTNTFDRNGSFGLTTSISNVAGVQSVDGSARYSGLNTIPTTSATTTGVCPTSPCPIVEPAPAPPFPVTPPSGPGLGGFAIAWGLDDKLKTPYSHVIDFSITRELPANFVFEASYIGRFAHRLLQEEDLAEPVNMRDNAGGQTYFQAVQALAKQYYAGADISTITPSLVGSYWQNLFPSASQVFGCAPNANGITTFTPTQAMYDLFDCFQGNETTAVELADVPGVTTTPGPGGCFPACATLNGTQTTGYDYYDSQYSSLFAWRSIGNSAYNAGQFSLRHKSGGLEFDINYTYSKSTDMGSNAERISEFEGFGLGSQIINSWFPNQNRAISDFDTTHIINANWFYELPFGRGKRFAANTGRIGNAVLGGWTWSGIWRWSTGYPFTLFSPEWATNFNLESPAVPVSKVLPKTGGYMVQETSGFNGPNVFKDPGITDAATSPNAAINLFRAEFPGEAGMRNGLRGPGTFDIDSNLLKNFTVREGQVLTFNWSVYNVTNTPRFDVGTMSLDGNTSLSSVSSFGNFSSTLSKTRVMEFGARYTF